MTQPTEPSAPGRQSGTTAPPRSLRQGGSPAGSGPAGKRKTDAALAGKRLGGPLAWIFWCACGITALPLAGVFSLTLANGFTGMWWALQETFAGNTLSAQVLRLGVIPHFGLFLWGAIFVVLTVMRSRHALRFAPLLLLVWVMLSTWCQFAIRDLMSPTGTSLGDFAALLPGILLQLAGVAALYGYFRESDRPKAYYNR